MANRKTLEMLNIHKQTIDEKHILDTIKRNILQTVVNIAFTRTKYLGYSINQELFHLHSDKEEHIKDMKEAIDKYNKIE